MHHWIDEIMPLRVWPKMIEAVQYNQIRIGILRLGAPLYLPLPELPGLTCALDPRTWVVFDETHNGIPILAWRDFHRQADDTLQASVICELRTFHMHAGLIMGRALDAIEHAVVSRRSGIPQPPIASNREPIRIR